MLFILGFLFIFVLGGLAGVMVALVPFDWQAHDTHFVAAHMHYVLFGGMVFPLFAALYYWLPLFSGRAPSERLSRLLFWMIFLGFNLTFLPMHVSGLIGMPRTAHRYRRQRHGCIFRDQFHAAHRCIRNCAGVGRISCVAVTAMRCLMPVSGVAVFVGLGAVPAYAAAHADTHAHHWWALDPWVWAPMLVLGALYLRGVSILRAKRRPNRVARPYALAAFGAGMAALFFALIWPLDALGAVSFAAHMAQHMVLMAVAAPLFALAEPSVPVMLALPASWRRLNPLLARPRKLMRMLLRPRIAFAIHAVVIWIWHAPLLFGWALRWQWVHVLEHIAFLGSALLFWAALRRAGRASGEGYGAAALWTLATLMHTGLLDALITFSPRLIYSACANMDNPPLPPMEDQQLAGLLMWIPAGLCYLGAGLGFVAAWLRNADRRERHIRAEAHSDPMP